MEAKRLDATELVEEACSELGYDLSHLIALGSIWVNPKAIEMMAPVDGVWYPHHRRANEGLRVNGERVEEVRQEIDGITLDNNTYANTCFKRALGVDRRNIVGFHICHIWPGTAYDERCYTQLANLVAIPRELSSLTDHHSTIVACLKFRSWELYGWKPPKELNPVKPADYPDKWRPPFPFNEIARKAILRRLGKDDILIDVVNPENSSSAQKVVSKPRASSRSAPFQELLTQCGFTNVSQNDRRFFTAQKGDKEFHFSVRVSGYSEARSGWWYTFYDTDDRFDEMTHLVGLMKSDADDGTLRDVAFVISPDDMQKQFEHRKTWNDAKNHNRFDVTIPSGSACKWDMWLTRIVDL